MLWNVFKAHDGGLVRGPLFGNVFEASVMGLVQIHVEGCVQDPCSEKCREFLFSTVCRGHVLGHCPATCDTTWTGPLLWEVCMPYEVGCVQGQFCETYQGLLLWDVV